MSTIQLLTNYSTDFTTVSNAFIDHYMPVANGSYVKVYLYLLRNLSRNSQPFSIADLADILDNTEKDIIRSLNYWEKVNLIQLHKGSNNAILKIELLEPIQPSSLLDQPPSQDLIQSHSVNSRITNESVLPIVTVPVAATNEAPTPKKEFIIPEKTAYNVAQINALSSEEDVQWILNIVEVFLEGLLKPQDVQLVLYLYDTLGFSSELIVHLYEYCISKGKKSASYIEAVAIAWATDGIDSVEKAEISSTQYNSNYIGVMKAFGLNRSPADVEKQYIDKWYHYGFDLSIIKEACDRSILNTQKADFKYANSILENWNKHNIHTKDGIAQLDTEHNNKSKATSNSTTKAPMKPSNNQFQAFPQRAYSNDEFTSMEQRLLHK